MINMQADAPALRRADTGPEPHLRRERHGPSHARSSPSGRGAKGRRGRRAACTHARRRPLSPLAAHRHIRSDVDAPGWADRCRVGSGSAASRGLDLHKDTRMCEAPPVPACASGYTLNANGVCSRPATRTCPPGSSMQGTVCVGPQPFWSCPSGGYYDSAASSCVRTPCIFSCSTTYDPPTRSCSGFAMPAYASPPMSPRPGAAGCGLVPVIELERCSTSRRGRGRGVGAWSARSLWVR